VNYKDVYFEERNVHTAEPLAPEPSSFGGWNFCWKAEKL